MFRQSVLKFAFVSVALVSIAQAGNLTPPLELENTSVLPKNVRNPRVRGLFMSLSEKFDGDQSVVPLGVKLNKVVTWNDVKNAKNTEQEKAETMGLVKSLGLDQTSTGPGSTTGQVFVNVFVTVPTLAYGVNDDVTVFAALPIYKMDVTTSTGFVPNEAGLALARAASERNPQKGVTAQENLVDPVGNKLEKNGYKKLQPTTSISAAGDAKFGGKFRIFKDDDNTLSAKVIVTAPTGIAPDDSLVVDTATGDGQWDLGTTFLWDYNFTGKIRLNTFAGYNMQFADKLYRRLPDSSDNSVTSDREEVSRKLGDQMSTGVSLNFGSSTRGLSAGAGYAYQYMEPTRYSGTQFAAERYRWLEELSPYQMMQTLTVMAGFSTIDMFKAKEFFYPFSATITYSRVLAGQNVPTADLVSGELVLFF